MIYTVLFDALGLFAQSHIFDSIVFFTVVMGGFRLVYYLIGDESCD